MPEEGIKFSTRMVSEDREVIKELTKDSGMSTRDYMTACCLGKQVVVIDGLKVVLALTGLVLWMAWSSLDTR